MHMTIIFKHLVLGNCVANLYVEHRKERGMKVNINGPGHMTKMAAMAINRKKLFKAFSSEP